MKRVSWNASYEEKEVKGMIGYEGVRESVFHSFMNYPIHPSAQWVAVWYNDGDDGEYVTHEVERSPNCRRQATNANECFFLSQSH